MVTGYIKMSRVTFGKFRGSGEPNMGGGGFSNMTTDKFSKIVNIKKFVGTSKAQNVLSGNYLT